MTETQQQNPLAVLAKMASEEHQADIYLYSGAIGDPGYKDLLATVAESPANQTAILILTTRGGDGASAYRIARLFQERYAHFLIYIPTYCYSAGTIVTLGAHRLIMDFGSELGPIDPQLRKHNEIAVQESVLASREAVKALGELSRDLFNSMVDELTIKSEASLSFKLAAETAATMTGMMMSSVFAKLDPTVFGTYKLMMDVAREYGRRLIERSGNATEETVEKLITEYPSHSFVIDRAEVKSLFNGVEDPSEPLNALANLCLSSVAGRGGEAVVMSLFALGQGEEENAEQPNDDAIEPLAA